MTQTAIINSKPYQVKQTGGRYFYFSPKALRWLPVAANKVSFA